MEDEADWISFEPAKVFCRWFLGDELVGGEFTHILS